LDSTNLSNRKKAQAEDGTFAEYIVVEKVDLLTYQIKHLALSQIEGLGASVVRVTEIICEACETLVKDWLRARRKASAMAKAGKSSCIKRKTKHKYR